MTPATLPRIAVAVFLTYATIGVALPVVPLWVHGRGFGDVLAGGAIGVQFAATLLTRAQAGRLADTRGPARTMRSGVALFSLGGALLVAAALVGGPPVLGLAVLFGARAVLGAGESRLITGGLAWAIALLGPGQSGRVMAVVGIGMYGALGVGAPIGLLIAARDGLAGIGVATVVLPLLALAATATIPAAPMRADAPRQSFRSIIGLIWPIGAGVALQGVGFAAIGAFVSLDYAAHRWPGAGFALLAFGAGFVGARLACGGLPDRLGGFRVAAVSLAVECVGQAVLWRAPTEAAALVGAALTGLGCSMVFPSLGVEVIRRVPAGSRGSALGGFAVFQDLAYGVTGPLAGLLTAREGYGAAFALGTGAAASGAALVLVLARRAAATTLAKPAETIEARR